MIQANELRVGNYIKSDDGIICSLECIESKNFTDWNSGNDYSLIAKEIGTKDNYLNCINDSWKPIPLTEEILLKCGFVLEDQMYNYFTHQDIPGIFQLFDGVAEYSIDSNDVCWVNNLHQLQNLFFALTGHELKIEL